MTSWLLPVGILAASLILTYLCCLRPMRHGRFSMSAANTSTGRCCARSGSGTDLDEAVNRARAELSDLTAKLG